ncbi:MAG TPA: ankyrin repeat domain-containing protein [Candidatus Angelobacter sp.]|jgi:ankyrin repeat protein|nr:ankyrin repeat domain-containing protein [Candidatus Angelobacter sp.]
MSLIQAIIRNDADEVTKLLKTTPSLARERLVVGATRQTATDFFFSAIEHYLFAGDTPLHAAAAGYRKEIGQALISNGADISARNRRGASPLHYASDGGPGVRKWDSEAQARMIVFLIEQGANPNALDKSGIAPLHRAVRQRSLSAVDALLRNGAAVRLKNKSGSTPLHLAVQNTGRGGSGLPEAKAFQKEIIERLLKAGANPQDRDGQGKTVRQWAQSDWIRALL